METPRTVGDIMTTKVAVLREEENLEQVTEGMERFKFRHLPVVDGERLVGMVSDRDILRASVSRLEVGAGAGLTDAKIKSSTFVASIMKRGMKTVGPETPLLDAARWLVSMKLSALPVVDDNGKLLGIVTDHDFLKLTVQMLDKT